MKKTLILLLALLLLPTALCEADTALPNPWTETTADGIMEALGLSFNLPEGAEEPVYRMMEGEGLAEARFALDGVSYCARMKSAAEFEDISGMYYTWEAEDDCEVQYCQGKVMRAFADDMTIDVCLWYDVVPGIMYSLTAQAADLDGFDIEAVAETMFVPAQGDS